MSFAGMMMMMMMLSVVRLYLKLRMSFYIGEGERAVRPNKAGMKEGMFVVERGCEVCKLLYV